MTATPEELHKLIGLFARSAVNSEKNFRTETKAEEAPTSHPTAFEFHRARQALVMLRECYHGSEPVEKAVSDIEAVLNKLPYSSRFK